MQERHTEPVLVFFAVLVLLTCCSEFAAAQDPPPPRPAPAVAQPDPTGPPVPASFGPGWGMGIGYSSNLTAPLVPIGGAFIDSLGFVRVTEERDAQPRLLMESHWTTRCFHALVGCGPAVFVQAAGGLTEDLFNAAGGGVVIELGSGTTSWNLIVGALLDFSVERLRPEYIHGFPSPTPELIFLKKKEVSYFVGVAIGRPLPF